MDPRSGRGRTADGVGLWWQLDGTGPAVVLVPGRGDSSDLFPPEFTDALIAGGWSVLRSDPRDTGLSDDGGDTYRLAEMADDVIAVCDDAGVGAVHVVAVSMGGMIAVDLAVRFPSRVASLVLLAAMSPDPQAGIGEAFFDGIDSDPVTGTLAGMGAPSADDAEWVRVRHDAALQRAAARPEAGALHQAAAFRLGWREHEDLALVRAPALVVHGTADRVLPPAHASAYAAGLPNATLHLVDGMGHLPTRAEWEHLADVTGEFLRHAQG